MGNMNTLNKQTTRLHWDFLVNNVVPPDTLIPAPPHFLQEAVHEPKWVKGLLHMLISHHTLPFRITITHVVYGQGMDAAPVK